MMVIALFSGGAKHLPIGKAVAVVVMREGAEICALAVEVELAVRQGAISVGQRQFDQWGAWVLVEADRLDPIKSGQVLSHLIVPELDADFDMKVERGNHHSLEATRA